MTSKTAASVVVVDPSTDILCVHRSRLIMNPQVFEHLRERPVFVGILLLRCVSRTDGRSYLYKGRVEVVELESGGLVYDSKQLIHRLPPVLEYRGNGHRAVVIEADTEIVLATGRQRTAARPEAKAVRNSWVLTDCRSVSSSIFDLSLLE